MNLNSRLFDSIRVKPRPEERACGRRRSACDHPGCKAAGEFRAPQGRDREGQFFCFCLEHVREYNASYNYFNGMSADDVAVYQRDALTGHRPTWAMGSNRAAKGFARTATIPQPRTRSACFMHARMASQAAGASPSYGVAAVKALDQLGLDDSAEQPPSRRATRIWSSGSTPTPTAATDPTRTACARSSAPTII